LAWEHRTGCLDSIIVDDHDIERVSNVRISPESFSPVDLMPYCWSAAKLTPAQAIEVVGRVSSGEFTRSD
jgi:hypothetical protein